MSYLHAYAKRDTVPAYILHHPFYMGYKSVHGRARTPVRHAARLEWVNRPQTTSYDESPSPSPDRYGGGR